MGGILVSHDDEWIKLTGPKICKTKAVVSVGREKYWDDWS